MVQNDPKVRHFLNRQMFPIIKLQYLRQYTIHFKLSYIYEFLTSSRIHTYITHIYQMSIKTPKPRCQIVEQKNSHRNVSPSGLFVERLYWMCYKQMWVAHNE